MNDSLITYGTPAALFIAFMLFRRVGQISAARARELVRSGAKLIDVRTPSEFSSGHLPGAVNVPLQEIGGRLGTLGPKEGPFVLYCASGARSGIARLTMTRAGFKQVFNLGAMSRW